jgi:hypothetical protein
VICLDREAIPVSRANRLAVEKEIWKRDWPVHNWTVRRPPGVEPPK